MKRLLRVPAALMLSLGLLTLALFLPQPRVAEVAQFDRDVINQSLQQTVRVVVPDDAKKDSYSTGSGSIIHPEGLVLTNYHVVADYDANKLYNKDGLVYLFVSPNAKEPPKPLYMGQVIKVSQELDLALVKVIANMDGTKLRATPRLPYYQLGSVDDVWMGDTLGIIGYPGIGRGTVTFTKGDVSGFTFFKNGNIEWIKTEALISFGNSGGTAIDLNGRLVGVPTEVSTASGGSGTLGFVRPIDVVPADWFSLKSATPAPKAEGVSYKGQIVDANSGRAIAGAVFAFFKPGSDYTDQNVIAIGVADASGYFLTEPAIPPGTYPLLIGAKGYKPITVDYQVPGGAALRAFEKPLALQRR